MGNASDWGILIYNEKQPDSVNNKKNYKKNIFLNICQIEHLQKY